MVVARTASRDAHEQGGDDGTPDAPQASEHDDRQQARDQVVVASRVEREDHPVHGARRGGRCHAEPEPERRDLPAVDAEEGRGDRVLNGRADRSPEPRPREDQVQDREHGHRDREREHPDLGHVVAAEPPRCVRVGRDRGAVVRVIEDAQGAFDRQGDRPRDQQRQLFTLVRSKRSDERQLDRHPQREHERGQQQDRQERVDVEHGERRVAQVGAQDDHGALRHVDDPHDPERERQPARHQRVDAAGQEPEDACLNDQAHARYLPSTCRPTARPRRANELIRPSSASGTPGRGGRCRAGRPAATSRRSTRRACRSPAATRTDPSSDRLRASASFRSGACR